MRIFRHAADAAPVAICVSAVAIASVAVAVRLEGRLFWAVVGISIAARIMTPALQHNHSHLPVFASRLGNALFDAILPLAAGQTTAVWELEHALGHHRQYLDPTTDVAGTERFAFTRSWPVLPKRLVYTILVDVLTTSDAWRIAGTYPKKARALRTRLVLQLLLQLAANAALLAVNPVGALVAFVLPNVALRWFVTWTSFGQHDGAPTTGVYDASNTHLGFVNRILLNVGHHTAHHEKPTLHWTLLPARTEKILHRIPTSCLRGPAPRRPSPGPLLTEAS